MKEEFIKFIQDLEYEVEVEFNKTFSDDMNNVNVVDVFIPSLNITIDYNDVLEVNDQTKPPSYGYDKISFFENIGIRHIFIWSYEWIHKNWQIKEYLKIQLQIVKPENRIYARECIVKECEFKEIKHLLEYHQQGRIFGTHYIGLLHPKTNEVLLTMIFQKPEYDKLNKFGNVGDSDAHSIRREICKPGYMIIGGKSKVFDYFIKKYNPNRILSYVDRSKFTGKSYKILGFELEGVNMHRYDWVFNDASDPTNYLKFKKRQPSIYRKMRDLYNDGKALRVYDSGRYRFVYTRPGYTSPVAKSVDDMKRVNKLYDV